MLTMVAARSQAYVCGRSRAGIAGSNPAGACMSFVHVVCSRYMSLRQADPSSREVLPSVVCLEYDLETSKLRRSKPK
jgi:hypothetical protein